MIEHARNIVKLGTVNLDGTEIKATADRREVQTRAHATPRAQQHRGEAAEFMRKAEPKGIRVKHERRDKHSEDNEAARVEMIASARELSEYERSSRSADPTVETVFGVSNHA